MDISEVKKNLNKLVKYKDVKNNIDGIYKLTGCILRKNAKGYFYQAELIDQKINCIMYAGLEDIEANDSM